VLQVQEPSAELSAIKVGDMITHVDGVPFSNAAEVCVDGVCWYIKHVHYTLV
jgi:PDZ domain-containing secreted protein